MNSFGLPPNVLDSIKKALTDHPDIKTSKIFGSRAKGTQKRYSDVDIAIFAGTNINIAHIKEDLEELDVIYKFDVVHYETLANAELKEHIDRVGITLT